MTFFMAVFGEAYHLCGRTVFPLQRKRNNIQDKVPSVKLYRVKFCEIV